MKVVFLTGKSCTAKTPFALSVQKKLGWGRVSLDNLYFASAKKDKQSFGWGQDTAYKRDWYKKHKPEKDFVVVEGLQATAKGERDLIKKVWGVKDYLVVEIENLNQYENAKVKYGASRTHVIDEVNQSYENQRELGDYKKVTTMEGFIDLCVRFQKEDI